MTVKVWYLSMMQLYWKSKKISYLCFIHYIICLSKFRNWILNKAININATKLGVVNELAPLHPSCWQVSQNSIWTFVAIFDCIHLFGFSSAYSQEHDREITILSATAKVMKCLDNQLLIPFTYLNASFSCKPVEACFWMLN